MKKTIILSLVSLFLVVYAFPGIVSAATLSFKINDVLELKRDPKPKTPPEEKKYDTFYQVKKIQGSDLVVDVYEKVVYGLLLTQPNLIIKTADITNDALYEVSPLIITPMAAQPGFIPAAGMAIATDAQSAAASTNQSVTLPSKLQVLGDIRVGDADSNGCVQSYDGTPLAGTCVSDERLKKDVQPFETILDKLVKLAPVTYHFRSDEFPEFSFGTSKQYGLIAQQVESLFPELVANNVKQGFKGVNYNLLPIYLLEGVKELSQRFDDLRATVSSTALGFLQGDVLQSINVGKLDVADAAVFNGSLSVEDHVELGVDTVGQARIKAGDTQVAVDFSKPYERVPVVMAAPVDFTGSWKMSPAHIDGFNLELTAPALTDVLFNWYAFEGSSHMTVSFSTAVVSSTPPLSVEVPPVDSSSSSTSTISSDTTSSSSADSSLGDGVSSSSSPSVDSSPSSSPTVPTTSSSLTSVPDESSTNPVTPPAPVPSDPPISPSST